MTWRAHSVKDKEPSDRHSSASLLPMLVAGIALTLIGMVAAVLLS